MILEIATAVLLVVCLVGILYLCAATYAIGRFVKSGAEPGDWRPPATMLKPLCGVDPGLHKNLKSFCVQDYPAFQVVFGVLEADDPAVSVVRELETECPETDMILVTDERVWGQNLKVSNLQNMMAASRHDILVISDSDISVERDYLARVVAPFKDPEVGLVTCLYRARPVHGLWSKLGAMGINYGFLPSVLFSRLLGIDQGCFGATMAIRRESLDRIGGFDAIKDVLSDDYTLGLAVRRAGQRVVISDHLVDNMVSESDLRSCFLHEVRWGRTLRSVAPGGYAASIVLHPVVLGILAVLVSGFAPIALLIAGAAILVRLWMVREIERKLGLDPAPLWLVPLRDIFSLAVFVTSLWGTRVVWRGRRFHVAAGGRMVPDGRS